MINHRNSTKLTIIAGFVFACGALLPPKADAGWFPEIKPDNGMSATQMDGTPPPALELAGLREASGANSGNAHETGSIWSASKRWLGALTGGVGSAASKNTELYDTSPFEDYSTPGVSMHAAIVPDMSAAITAAIPAVIEEPLWNKNAVKVAGLRDDMPKIAVVIDDLGLDRRRSNLTTALPGPLTLAWLPYAHELPEQTQAAQKRGHELMVHMPMEPLNPKINPGPNALRTGLSPDELLERVTSNLAQFDGYVGINNHMGSRFTQDVNAMSVVMNVLRNRDLLYLDSRTIKDSVAEKTAQRFNVPTTSRDVFLDHFETAEGVSNALEQLERIAREHGTAVAIGHPKDVTLAALTEWLPQARARGLQIVPLSEIVKHREGRFMEARDIVADDTPGDVTLLVPRVSGAIQ